MARRKLPAAILAVVGSEGVGTASSSTVSRSIRAAARAFSSGVSPGTVTNVPLDCSPAMISTARRGSMIVSTK